MSESEAIDILVEARALTALHTAEAVKAKLDTIRGLRERIEQNELEDAIRDHIAENPWLLSPKWETFEVERSLSNIGESSAEEETWVDRAADRAGLGDFDDWNRRVDLVLTSGSELLVIEFMRPGLTVDDDHLTRFQKYVYALRNLVESNTRGRHDQVTGLLVADDLSEDGVTMKVLKDLQDRRMDAMDWETLLREAEAQWDEFFDALTVRAPDDDPRVDNLRKGYPIKAVGEPEGEPAELRSAEAIPAEE